MFLATSYNWWEPGTAGVFDIGDLVAFVAFFTGITTILIGLSRWWMKTLRGIIKEEIEIATEPIHPASNGGLSLADVARRTASVETQINEIIVQNNDIHDMLKALSSEKKPTQKRRAS
jgi:uncharacterized protein YaaQ